jgi:Fic family protein
MKWNWQQDDWPRFSWSAVCLEKAEQRFLREGGVILGALRHIGDEEQQQVRIEILSDEATTTSEIEGEFLDRASVQSSIRRELGVATERFRASPAERGIAEMMLHLVGNHDADLDHETLFTWHEMLMRGRNDLDDVGCYRRHADPMRIVSGRMHRPTVHFEAPPSSSVPAEMDTFVDWFNRTAPGGADALPALARAGTVHLYFESIHPFEDGNGRIGRALSEKVLSQGLGWPTLTSLAATILVHRREYYARLKASNKRNEITGWNAWFAGIVLEAQQRTQALVEFTIQKSRLLDRLRDDLNARQMKAMLRVLRAGPTGFEGGLSAANYRSITRASPATATRDLVDLVSKGALRRTGQRRHARYHVNIPVRSVEPIDVDLGE